VPAKHIEINQFAGKEPMCRIGGDICRLHDCPLLRAFNMWWSWGCCVESKTLSKLSKVKFEVIFHGASHLFKLKNFVAR
jgi:hypothetical protein